MNRNEIIKQLKAYASDDWYFPARPAGGAAQSEKFERLRTLEERCRTCGRCSLSKTAKKLVFSDGDPDSRIVFIGEAPGEDEDNEGRPFVGRAGKLLTKVLSDLGMERKKVYICNILKHRPPGNRNPMPDEIEACTPYLNEQLEIVQPLVAVTLGNFSTQFILLTKEGISKLRGVVRKSVFGFKVVPTFHPAAVLRDMGRIGEFQSDLKIALDLLKPDEIREN